MTTQPADIPARGCAMTDQTDIVKRLPELAGRAANSYDAALIREAAAELTQLRADLNTSRSVVKDICAEWHEDCEPCCDSYGHDEHCRATSIAAAKRALNAEVAQLRAEVERLKGGLKFYADGAHAVFNDESAWDTVSGEPQNFWCDEAGTATVEDGWVAKRILEGWALPDDPNAEEMIPPAALAMPTEGKG